MDGILPSSYGEREREREGEDARGLYTQKNKLPFFIYAALCDAFFISSFLIHAQTKKFRHNTLTIF
jgi:hypothetical protein